jgi:hypothetical protein
MNMNGTMNVDGTNYFVFAGNGDISFSNRHPS